MGIVIKPGGKLNNTVKYLIIDSENKHCNVILRDVQSEEQGIVSTIQQQLPDFKITSLKLFSLEKELNFVWPQIVDELKKISPQGAGWLTRAKFSLDEKQLVIELENNISFKFLADEKISQFLKTKVNHYLETELELVFKNGNFLQEIENDPQQLQQKFENKTKPGKKSVKIKTKSIEVAGEEQLIYGKKISKDITDKINEIRHEGKKVIVEGTVFDLEKRKTKNGKLLYIVSLTDRTDSITAKMFLDDISDLQGKVIEGDALKIRGRVRFDTYSQELTIMIEDMQKIPCESKQDLAEEKRVELHLHTQMSAMDSVVNVKEVIKKAADWGHPAIAITDHGVVQAFPDAHQAGKKYGIKIIYGLEAYLVDDGEPIVVNPPAGDIDDQEFVVFDLETTGLNPRQAEIIEIGAVKISAGKIVDQFTTFVKPAGSIPQKITEITGITGEMVTDAPLIEDILTDFLEFIGDSVLVAHNASFDYSFLQSALKAVEGKKRSYSVLDTLALSRALLPDLKNHKLNTLTAHLGISLENHHRAVHDARATAEMLQEFILMLKDRQISGLAEINQLSMEIDWKELPTYHAVILAKNQAGLTDIYRLISNSHLNHFYRKPRILKSQLLHQRDNIIIGSACEAGELYRAIINDRPSREIYEIARFYDYLEIQPLGNNSFLIPDRVGSEDELKQINKRICQLAAKLNKPVVATGDVHFIEAEDAVYRKILQAGQGYEDVENQAPLYFRTTDEMLAEFDYLGEELARKVVIDYPNQINDRIEELKPLPDGLFTPEIDGAEEQIREMTYNRAHQLYGQNLPEKVEARLERELNSIINNGFAVIYLISHKLVKKSLEDGYLVGSRGSVGSSLVATMCEITEVNPLPPHYRCPECYHVEFIEDGSAGVGVDLEDKKCVSCGVDYIKDGYDIPFEVFMGFEGDKVPDIDLNFSGEYQSSIHQYTEDLFGRDYVFKAGTISTIAERTAYGFVKGYMTDNNYNYKKAEINRLVKGCTGVRRTTGQHPGGLMVVPRHLDIHNFSPIQHPANDQNTTIRTTHFDYHSISGRILKLDLLGHDDPTTLRMLQDLTGVGPDSIPLDDPDTMSIFSSTAALKVKPEEIGTEIGTLGIPEFGTSFVRQMLMDTKPTTMAELIRISGLSHGTDVWLNNAQELIRGGKAQLAEVISVRDDIMNYLIQQGLEPGKAFWTMEHVRKGKGLTEEEETYMREFNIPEWYIDSCKKIKYMFPKAHAAAYVMMAFRIAYFKVHYPEAFYTTYFSIKADEFDAQMIGQGYDYISNKKNELEQQGNNLTAKEKGILTVLEIVIEAMARGIKFRPVDLYQSDASRFKITDEGLLPPLVSLQGLGSSAADSVAVSREEGEFSSIEDLVNRTKVTRAVVEILREHGSLKGMPEKNQLSLF